MGGKVYLVGGGPGDPGLITLKGAEVLARADVVVYDRLVNPALLNHARPEASLIFVGKEPGKHALSQEEINSLLVRYAREGKVVVRLKGGDPFVFGRGGEEAEALSGAGIPFEVVPGVTAAIAAPAYAGIPLTHRNYVASFTVATGSEDPEKEDSNLNWESMANNGTLVFLMGMAHLETIVQKLQEKGMPGSTPAAVIQWGTTGRQRQVTAPLKDLVREVEEAGLTNPAVVVVGQVVKLSRELAWFTPGPLKGKRVLVTRARHQASRLSRALAALGGEAVECPVIRIDPPEDWGPLDRALDRAGTYDWVVFTSVNGVEHFFRRLREKKKDIRAFAKARFVALGPATAEVLREKGLEVADLPEAYRAEELVESLRLWVRPGERVLLPRADLARKLLEEALKALGCEVESVVAYHIRPAQERVALARRLLEAGEIDAVTFTSSSTVRFLVEALGEEAGKLLGRVTVASIGPVTSQTARELGIKVDVEAKEYTIPGLVAALAAHFGSEGGLN
ncbi:uroporphyrinogen-III C-methyltransferase [Ammonifex thiophilus]|uniref:uroporphyrinogen-III C-methyltransferase n=1 Tax=Ammonifex thiophilus TaxID=444093 RepID=A0A3D8P312_9THEO|nr:uroporphyrinogen-III C-methyltransferase [Ammonifex thiophilus]RDV83009.1 uroporphyrinogen-III C-methyltransferase [Ammonifex thiophilus]